jgi:hypothetical protein
MLGYLRKLEAESHFFRPLLAILHILDKLPSVVGKPGSSPPNSARLCASSQVWEWSSTITSSWIAWKILMWGTKRLGKSMRNVAEPIAILVCWQSRIPALLYPIKNDCVRARVHIGRWNSSFVPQKYDSILRQNIIQLPPNVIPVEDFHTSDFPGVNVRNQHPLLRLRFRATLEQHKA